MLPLVPVGVHRDQRRVFFDGYRLGVDDCIDAGQYLSKDIRVANTADRQGCPRVDSFGRSGLECLLQRCHLV